MLHAVIMAGGSGTRFWPQSRKRTPKQLLRLAGTRTMIQQTADRCRGWVDPSRLWIVTNEVQAEATIAQLPEVPPRNVLREPAARNTAPCVGLAAIQILEQDPDGIMFVMPADHVIQTEEAFAAAARKAVETIEGDDSKLVLFGVIPTFPATGYGYIERRELLSSAAPRLYSVNAFREKPHRTLSDLPRIHWRTARIACGAGETIGADHFPPFSVGVGSGGLGRIINSVVFFLSAAIPVDRRSNHSRWRRGIFQRLVRRTDPGPIRRA